MVTEIWSGADPTELLYSLATQLRILPWVKEA